ncbi:MAG TPA: dienelactone hydrolase family protein [Chloroflexota bacterium]|nr:dienelactone hydrolase family protein [Chloroflexota bacterium]
MYEAMIAETIGIAGHNGDIIQAYYARPITATPVAGVIVLHHMPGWDEWSTEVTRKLAYHGYAAISPHLYSRVGTGRWDDIAAAARAQGGAPDAQVVGDAEGAAAFLRAQPDANGRVGTIGFCSGGRQAYMLACKIPSLNAAVDCWGGRVIVPPEQCTPQQPVPVITMTKEMNCPLLGIFGNDDANPDVAQVNRTEEILREYGKEYEFYRYDGAGHGFFATDRPGYRPEQAVDGWKKVFAFYEKHLATGDRG